MLAAQQTSAMVLQREIVNEHVNAYDRLERRTRFTELIQISQPVREMRSPTGLGEDVSKGMPNVTMF